MYTFAELAFISKKKKTSLWTGREDETKAHASDLKCSSLIRQTLIIREFQVVRKDFFSTSPAIYFQWRKKF